MTNLGMDRVDPPKAAELVRANVLETLPTADVVIRTFGDPQQPSYREAVAQGYRQILKQQIPSIFVIVVDVATPRPIQIRVPYVGVGRGARPTAITYLARLGQCTPGEVAFKRGRLMGGRFGGEPGVAAALSGVPGLGGAMRKLLREKTVYGTVIFRIEPSAAVVPDEKGAILVAVSAPARPTIGISYYLDLAAFLDIAQGIDGALGSVEGVKPASTINAPLTD
jgi:hypothetical protein